MRKKVLGLVMAALAISTFGAFAAQQTEQPKTEQQAPCCKEKKGDQKKGDKKGHKKGDKKGHKMAQGPKLNPFTGIQLTPEQQQKIDQLKADRKAKREAGKKADKEVRKAEREKFNAEVAKILTPEQYKIYQANCDSLKAKKADFAKKKGERKDKKDGRKGGPKGPKAEKK